MGVDIFVFNAAALPFMDPFEDPHLTLALYSVGIALVLTVLVLAGVIADHYNERERHARHGKKWWHK
jgi:hypothetical protein